MNNREGAPEALPRGIARKLSESEEVSALRRWLSKRAHLPDMSERELKLFLRLNERSLEPTKAAIEAYYAVRASAPRLFANRDLYSRELRRVINVFSMLPLAEKSSDGQSVMVLRLLDGEAEALCSDDCLKLGLMYLDLWLRTRVLGTIAAGLVLVFDTTGFGLGQVARLVPERVRELLRCVQLGLPVRLRALHFLNASAASDVLVNMIKPLVTRTIADGVHAHRTLDSLEEYVPVERLPYEMGGKAGSLRSLHEAQVRRLENHRDWFLNEETRVRVYEIKRPRRRDGGVGKRFDFQ